MKKLFKLMSLVIAVALVFTMFGGCAGKAGDKAPVSTQGTVEQTAEEKQQEPIEYSYLDLSTSSVPFGFNNQNDVVSPEIEKKFNVKCKEFITNASLKPLERMRMLVAADNVPDVVKVDNPNLPLFYEMDVFAELDQYKNLLPNIDKYINDTGWNMLKVNGKLVALPTPGGSLDEQNPELNLKDDLFYRPAQNWAMIVREDILKQLGYKFKTVADLQTELDGNLRRITKDDAQLEPAINTVEDFEKLLYGIKNLNIKVGGKPLIPLAIPDWGVYHLAPLYTTTGGWYCDPDTMQVTGFVDNPNAKDLYKNLTKWYRDGILDNDYLIQKPEQLQEKIASGRVACFFSTQDLNAAKQNLISINKEWTLRPIPWPASASGKPGFIDPSYPCGFMNIMISKKFEKNIPRLFQYFDWFQTEEAMDLLSWGPESAGLWEMKDGKKVFKDSAMYEAFKSGGKTPDGKSPEYYGIQAKTKDITGPTSKAVLTSIPPFFSTKTIERSYPVRFDAYEDLYKAISTEKLCTDGTVLSAVGEKSNASSGYYWSTSRTTKVAKLLSTKDDAAFDKVWDELLNDFKEKSGYEEARAEMLEAFKVSLGKK